MDASDKIVFITGGSKGIGKALIGILAPSYYKIIFTYQTDKNSADTITGTYDNCVSYQCDLLDYERCEYIANQVLSEYGSIDILINNAGRESDSLFEKMTKESWDDVIDVNLKSIFNFTHHFIPGMIDREWGRIINFSSIAGFTGAWGKSNYAAAKAGVVGFSKSLALELASKGITVNIIAPGAIDTDMLRRIPDKYLDNVLNNIPMKRFGQPSEVAQVVDFLISDKAAYISGQTFHINGGSFLY